MGQETTPIVAIEAVGLRRAGTPLLEAVSWRILPRRHAALLGANGSGKTTLLRVITGYEWPSEGRVQVLGKVYGQANLPALRRRIGWVSSSLEQRIPGRDTAREVVLSGCDASLGVYRPFDAAEAGRAMAALCRVGMEALSERPYGVLSQGERQRALIARALMQQPELLILDEPCAGLDPVARRHLLDDLGRLAADPSGPTQLLVTHHIEEIGPWVADAVVLKRGRVLCAGPVEAVLTSDVLSDAFDWPCTVSCEDGAWQLRPAPG